MMRAFVGVVAIVAPLLHTATDALEILQGGFSRLQLWLNYAAFLPMPALMVGLYAVQRPRLGRAGLVGALVYGATFVYFAHTTLVALAERTSDYAALWARLGATYTLHGAVMVAGGLLFGWASWRAGVVSRVAAALFIAGLSTNLAAALAPVPDVAQTIGTGIRNAGLIAMGWRLAAADAPASPPSGS
jgi:hypothetical protein